MESVSCIIQIYSVIFIAPPLPSLAPLSLKRISLIHMATGDMKSELFTLDSYSTYRAKWYIATCNTFTPQIKGAAQATFGQSLYRC